MAPAISDRPELMRLVFCIRPEYEVDTKERLFPRRLFGLRARPRLLCVRRVAPHHLFEPGIQDEFSQVIRWNQMAVLLLTCPRDREDDLSVRAFYDILENQAPARFQYTMDLAIEGRLVGNVHLHLNRPCEIEAGRFERHFESARTFERYPIGKSGEIGQIIRCVDKCSGQVDTGHATPELSGEKARRPANAASDVNDV